MRLTSLSDYALRLLMYVGARPERLCTIAEVATAYGISEAHLMKITHQLAVGGWIETVRGKGGGMRLAKKPGDIRLGDVVRTTETDFRIVECFASGSPCTLTGDCRLTGILHGALQDFLKRLDGHTLADILPPGGAGQAPSGGVPVRLSRRNPAGLRRAAA